jgi:hypothetical protein
MSNDSNHIESRFGSDPKTFVAKDHGSKLTLEEAEHNVLQRSYELAEATNIEKQLTHQVRGLEAELARVQQNLVSAKNELTHLRQHKIPQCRRELQFAFNQQAGLAPIPLAQSVDDLVVHPSRGFAAPGGAFDQERAKAFAPPASASAELAETKRLYEITLAQMQARGVPITVKAPDETPADAAPAQETK